MRSLQTEHASGTAGCQQSGRKKRDFSNRLVLRPFPGCSGGDRARGDERCSWRGEPTRVRSRKMVSGRRARGEKLWGWRGARRDATRAPNGSRAASRDRDGANGRRGRSVREPGRTRGSGATGGRCAAMAVGFAVLGAGLENDASETVGSLRRDARCESACVRAALAASRRSVEEALRCSSRKRSVPETSGSVRLVSACRARVTATARSNC